MILREISILKKDHPIWTLTEPFLGLNLSDLSLIPGIKDALKLISPTGIINFTGHYTLADLDWKKISLNAKATAAQISLYGFAFTEPLADPATLSDNSQTLKLNSVILAENFP